ncbi:MAG: transporter substrate-binding domain-containing protein [Spirochaetales bacterium]|nr:transporter substrate-binding domain-containing protein [Spirochaetales bacterium]
MLLPFILLSKPVSALETDRIIIAINAWEPLKSEEEPYGVLAQITREAFELEGLSVEFRVAPWKRGYDNVKDGIWHGIVGWNRTAEREKLFFISTPLILEDVVFFHRKDLNLDWNDVSDLQGLSVGMIDGYNYGPLLSEAIDRHILRTEVTGSEEQSILMLEAKRFDLWPCEADVGVYLVKNTLKPIQEARLTYHPRPIQVSDLCLLLSRKIPENESYYQAFERGYARLKASGRLKELIEEFLPGSSSLKYLD